MGQSSFQRTQNEKRLQKLHKLEAANNLPLSTEMVRGRATFDFTNKAIAYVVGFAAVFVVGLMLGYVIIPGVVFGVLAYDAAKPGRFIAVGPAGLSVWSESLWRGGPKAMLGNYAPNAMTFVDDSTVQVGELRPIVIGKAHRETAKNMVHGGLDIAAA